MLELPSVQRRRDLLIVAISENLLPGASFLKSRLALYLEGSLLVKFHFMKFQRRLVLVYFEAFLGLWVAWGCEIQGLQ